MDKQTQDQSVLDHIQQLVSEEHRLYAQGSMSETDRERMTKLQVELDQCWDLLRRRRALRDVGQDPDGASVRGANVVENYEQ
jgi:hypothetical protein